jgi:hypothetical protein
MDAYYLALSDSYLQTQKCVVISDDELFIIGKDNRYSHYVIKKHHKRTIWIVSGKFNGNKYHKFQNWINFSDFKKQKNFR